MAVEIKVPTLGESIVEATVGAWRKHEGDPITAGEVLVELETDKVTVEVTAEESGVLSHILKPDGAIVTMGEILGIIAETAETPVAAQSHDGASGTRVMATPVARRVAETQGVDIAAIPGSGPGGRVTKEDVLKRERAPRPAPMEHTPPPPAPTSAPPPVPAPVSGEGRREERIRMSRRRQTIAARLVEAQRTAAMLTTFNEIDMSAVIDLRKRHRDPFRERHGVGLGFMSFFTKAVIGALKAFPLLNAEIRGDEIIIKHYYDIGIAVSTDEGLVVPVLRDANRLSFAEIERGIEELARRARESKLTIADLQGGTFTITNGGIFGSLMSTPILNTPQVGILGMHKIQERPVALDGQVVIRPMMYVALSYDHRIIDGREAVSFLVRVKELVEDPERLLLEG
ncbi:MULTISPECIES: 2-oxoglutarate dehydrogenase complex dihydrolipoyllysine-residue succinyltransferase [Roseiflexus]|jgi:2-oxoglutarate dehydrogenase E2 component (dihydrolipoamide succinyltransferase)|uniref:Dihydrolipoyllysine-residue succinyltransferase component of 2-oxoglutarate dehydrogenase complex n=1 Tax=Roseiflexus castenholzii (strain DSM 13941 / HLO8) TaxID=383372 RepID=A7NJF4_ROSCS|nr:MULTISPECIES: 2-oxoglutarate dehydrogenase complex dihydrolipoyllysine-residue succinyltransferase [Roseiflexus]ABU57624.1 2-oxoglutarate dehydrogenase, E2 subunit, dihydrolipoamide succinyltransferase [Roseiflexus castenholzii DSM 13941]GIW00517.1 MAG: dihydrolipoyllysine-residue succinyltransferase component of 2-oxoglutarate dehydrogenase complex [Roseiflexus sp.]